MQHWGDFLPSEFDALERNEAMSLLAQCLTRLPPTLKKFLAMHCNENLPLADIAACFGLTEFEIDQIRAKTLEMVPTILAAELGRLVFFTSICS
jgi:DNA-directed RNA polymerase specialized sigma24 family protein